MAATNPGFEVVGGTETEQAPPQANNLHVQMLTIALKALSDRALIALASLFSIILAGSVFALFWVVLPNPSINQLIGLGGYALFILALHAVRRK